MRDDPSQVEVEERAEGRYRIMGLDASKDRVAEDRRERYNSILGYYTLAASGWRLVERVFGLGQLTPNCGQLHRGELRKRLISVGFAGSIGRWHNVVISRIIVLVAQPPGEAEGEADQLLHSPHSDRQTTRT